MYHFDLGYVVIILFVLGFFLAWALLCGIWEWFDKYLYENHRRTWDRWDYWLWRKMPELARYEYYEDDDYEEDY